MTLVDLIHQVQKWLPVRFGGTGNPHGWATDALLGAYVNGTGGTIARGTLVQLANYGTIGGGNIGDSRIRPTSTADQQNVLGVVMGRYRTDDPVNEFEDADCEDGNVCAVVIAGKALANVEGSVLVAQYAYSAATDGAAYGATYLTQGGMGTWESAGSGRQWIRLWGAPTTPGVMGALLVCLGDGVTLLQAGTQVDVPVPWNLLFIDWTIVSTLSGSVSVDIYMDDYGVFPPTGGDSITEASPPNIVSGIKNQGTVPYGTDVFGFPSGWAQDVDEGKVLRFIVESASNLKQVSLLMRYIRR